MPTNDTEDGVARAQWAWPPERSPDRQPWYVEVDLGVIDGRVECIRLQIGRRGEGGGPVTSQALRSIPLRRLVDETIQRQRKRLAAELEDDRTMGDLRAEFEAMTGAARPATRRPGNPQRIADRAAEQLDRLPADAKRRGRPRLYGDDHWEAVATTYRKAHQHQQPPAVAVAEAWGVSRSTATGWVRRARQKGLLGPTDARRPGERKP